MGKGHHCRTRTHAQESLPHNNGNGSDGGGRAPDTQHSCLVSGPALDLCQPRETGNTVPSDSVDPLPLPLQLSGAGRKADPTSAVAFVFRAKTGCVSGGVARRLDRLDWRTLAPPSAEAPSSAIGVSARSQRAWLRGLLTPGAMWAEWKLHGDRPGVLPAGRRATGHWGRALEARPQRATGDTEHGLNGECEPAFIACDISAPDG